MDVSFPPTESYQSESPARLSEEVVHSLYADELPNKRMITSRIEQRSNLADTVSFENNIMLNPEDLTKDAARNMKDDREFYKAFCNSKMPKFSVGKIGLQKVYGCETIREMDGPSKNSTPEARTSVIREMSSTRPQFSDSHTSINDRDMESGEYPSLRCYEKVESEKNDIASRNPRIMQKESVTTQSDTMGQRFSDKHFRTSISGNHAFQMSSIETRPTNQSYFPHTMSHATYCVQLPPEFDYSRSEGRGKHYIYDGSGHALASSVRSYGGLTSKYIADGKFMQNHVERPRGNPGLGLFDGRPHVSSESLQKVKNMPQEQDSIKINARESTIPKTVEEKNSNGQVFLEQESMTHGSKVLKGENRQIEDSKMVKNKRGVSGKTDGYVECQQCRKKFCSSSALAKHKATHSDERKYICHICEKGFKRQDHLNGHLMTHRDKKPFECQYCEKSYCDHRSLKRHYENYHPNQDRIKVNPAPSHRTNTEILRPVQIEGRFTPEQDEIRRSPMDPKFDLQRKEKFVRKRNSDSMCSNNSDDIARRADNESPRLVFDNSQTAIGMLKQVIESHEQNKEKNMVEGYPRPGYYQYPDPQRWLIPYHQAHMMKLMQMNQPPILVQHGNIPPMNPYCSTDPPQLVPIYHPVNQKHPSNEPLHDDNGTRKGDDEVYECIRDTAVPTDPTSVAITNAKEDQDVSTRHLQLKDDYPREFPHSMQWKTIKVPNNGMAVQSMGNIQQSNMIITSHNSLKRERPVELNIHIPNSQIDFRPHDVVTSSEHQAKRYCPPPPSPSSLNMAKEGLLKLAEPSFKSEENQDRMFKNPPTTPVRKPRHRPSPINISCSNFQYDSPPIYTPPPMLSPHSIFHTPRVNGTPITPGGRIILSAGARSRKNSIDEDNVGAGADVSSEVIIPEPKINIGPAFQANVPTTTEPRERTSSDKHRAAVCWLPFEQETRKRAEEIEAYLEMACSVAMFGGGSNKEYALHVLFRLKGNIKLAVKHILANKSAIRNEDCLADYHYEGSDRWSSKERLKFREAHEKYGKKFHEIAKEIKGKTAQQCVEFYYLWKACRTEGTRSRRGYTEEIESEHENVDIPSDDDSETVFFVCDFPECTSSFISRQALNGHIRVHGGSFMKPEPKRMKVRTTASCDSSGRTSASTSTSRVTTKTSRTVKTTPAEPVLNSDGTLAEFPCKVCGRVFNKIKSRSAHMKTHVKRNDDNGGKSKS